MYIYTHMHIYVYMYIYIYIFLSHLSHTLKCFTVLCISYCLGNTVWRETLAAGKFGKFIA